MAMPRKIEAQLQNEVHELLARAAAADLEPLPADLNIPQELARREARLLAIRAAKTELEGRAAERYAAEQADYQAKLKAREDKTKHTGKKPRGKPPTPPGAGVRANDQVVLTEPDSRIMPVAGDGFEQCYNAQAAVYTKTLLVVATDLTQATSDKQQLTPAITTLNALPEDLGEVTRMLDDAGNYSAANVTACVNVGIEPLLASSREAHHLPWQERFSEPPSLATPADAVERMKHRMRTRNGRAWYALRKQTVEPVFGIIKAVMGFRQFLLRGLDAVRGAWSLATMAWNIRRMAALRSVAPG